MQDQSEWTKDIREMIIEDPEAYQKMWQTDFVPPQRWSRFVDRIALYHSQTPDEMDNRDALPYSRALHKWVSESGYTQEEFNQAKRDYWQMKGHMK